MSTEDTGKNKPINSQHKLHFLKMPKGHENVTKQKWFCCSPAQWGIYAAAYLLSNCTTALMLWKEAGKHLTIHPNRTPTACIKSNNTAW